MWVRVTVYHNHPSFWRTGALEIDEIVGNCDYDKDGHRQQRRDGPTDPGTEGRGEGWRGPPFGQPHPPHVHLSLVPDGGHHLAVQAQEDPVPPRDGAGSCLRTRHRSHHQIRRLRPCGRGEHLCDGTPETIWFLTSPVQYCRFCQWSPSLQASSQTSPSSEYPTTWFSTPPGFTAKPHRQPFSTKLSPTLLR